MNSHYEGLTAETASKTKHSELTDLPTGVVVPRCAKSRRPVIPLGSWPRRMSAELAAGHCGEPSRPGLHNDGRPCEAIMSEAIASAISNLLYRKMARAPLRKAP